MIDTNAVDAQLGHASDVAFALIGVNERIIGDELVGNSRHQSANESGEVFARDLYLSYSTACHFRRRIWNQQR